MRGSNSTVLIADPIVLNNPEPGVYTSARTPRMIVEEQMGGIFVEGPITDDMKFPASKTVFSYQPTLTPTQITEAVGDGQFDGIVVAAKAVKPKPGKEKIGDEPFLKFAVRIGAGTNNVEEVGKAGGKVMNMPGFNSEPTADAMVYAINQMRSPDPVIVTDKPYDFYRQTQDVRKNQPGLADSSDLSAYYHGEKLEFKGTKPKKLRVAIIGAGHIGGMAAQSLLQDGHEVVACGSERFTPEKAAEMGVEYAASAVEAAKGADVIIVQTPLNDKTKGIVDAKVLAVANDGVTVVNAGRGPLVDAAALEAAVRSKKVGSIIVDVDHFPGKEDSPMKPYLPIADLLPEGKAMLTPHTYADTHSPSREVGGMQAIRQAFRAVLIWAGVIKEPYINEVGGNNPFKAKEDGCKPETLHPTIASAMNKGGLKEVQTSAALTQGIAKR